MTKSLTVHHQDTLPGSTHLPDTHQDTFSKTLLGFWMYLMSDCLIFACLFVNYALFHSSTFGGPSSKELFSLSSAFLETMLLLFSSVSCGFGMLAAVKNKTRKVLFWFGVTFLLGASFVVIEVVEFADLVHAGSDWTVSAFLSSFFALVGTHGLHVSFGLLWMSVMMSQLALQGITVNTFRRLVIFSLFWHFLDVIWIFIFTFVYLIGVI